MYTVRFEHVMHTQRRVEYVHCENSNAAAITAYALKKNENVLTVTIHCGMAEQQIK